MTITLLSNATVDKASFVYVAENGLTNMRDGATVTVVGTMADSTVNGHAAKGSGAAVDSYLSAAINGAVAANQSYAVIMVGTFGTATDTDKIALNFSGSAACRPKIIGGYSAGARKVSASSGYAGLNFVGSIPGDNWTNGQQLSIIVGRNTSAGMAGSLNNAATVNGFDDATIRAATLASTDLIYFGGSPKVGAAETGQAGFAVSMCALFVGVTPEELRTYIGADPWADKIVTISASSDLGGNVTLGDHVLSGAFATDALSQLANNIPLDDFVLGGVLGLAPGIVTTSPFKNWTGTLLPGITIPNVVFLKLDRTQALVLVNQTTAGDGVLTITNAALVTGTYYIMVSFNTEGSSIGAELVLAA